MSPYNLTQKALIAELRARDIIATPQRVHTWIRAHMPTVPGGKKPRFNLLKVLAWLEVAAEGDPLDLETRDRLFLRQLKAS